MSRVLFVGITHNLDFALANLLIGIKKHFSKKIDRVYVLNDGLSEETKWKLSQIGYDICFVDFSQSDLRKRLAKLGVADQSLLDALIAKYSHFYFAKFEMLDYLKFHDEIFWLDCDMLIKADFSGIFDVAADICWVPTMQALKGKVSAFEDSYIQATGVCQDKLINGSQPNGGLLVLKKSLYEVFNWDSDFAYSIFYKLKCLSNKHYLDETTFATMALIDEVRVGVLNKLYNMYPWRKGASDASIVHCMGKYKFWNTPQLVNGFEEWQANNERWLEYGGGGGYNSAMIDADEYDLFIKCIRLRRQLRALKNKNRRHN